jgi:hypothetical protein
MFLPAVVVGFLPTQCEFHRPGPPIAWFKDPAGTILSVIQE